jgi:hypothetical protein
LLSSSKSSGAHEGGGHESGARQGHFRRSEPLQLCGCRAGDRNSLGDPVACACRQLGVFDRGSALRFWCALCRDAARTEETRPERDINDTAREHERFSFREESRIEEVALSTHRLKNTTRFVFVRVPRRVTRTPKHFLDASEGQVTAGQVSRACKIARQVTAGQVACACKTVGQVAADQVTCTRKFPTFRCRLSSRPTCTEWVVPQEPTLVASLPRRSYQPDGAEHGAEHQDFCY